MSLSSKLNAWIKSPQGQSRLQNKLEEYNRNGVKKTAAGDSVIPETRIYEAAAKFIQVLQMTAKSYDLPDSVMKHIEGMSSTGTDAGGLRQSHRGRQNGSDDKMCR